MKLTFNLETSKCTPDPNGNDNADATNAVSRLGEEAKQALSFGIKGVRDVTEDFTAASDRLEAGQLVKDEFFTLFEAVGALEVCVKSSL